MVRGTPQCAPHQGVRSGKWTLELLALVFGEWLFARKTHRPYMLVVGGGPGANRVYASIGSKQGKTATFPFPAAV